MASEQYDAAQALATKRSEESETSRLDQRVEGGNVDLRDNRMGEYSEFEDNSCVHHQATKEKMEDVMQEGSVDMKLKQHSTPSGLG